MYGVRELRIEVVGGRVEFGVMWFGEGISRMGLRKGEEENKR